MGDNRGFWKLPTRHENKNETASPSNCEPLIIVTGRSVKSIQMGMLDMLSMVKILERENIDKQVRNQDLIRGGPRSGTMKFADVAKRSCASEASPIAAGGPGPTQGPWKLWGF